jgi:hypothetical protein
MLKYFLVGIMCLWSQSVLAGLSPEEKVTAKRLYFELGPGGLRNFTDGRRLLSEGERSLLLKFLREEVNFTIQKTPKDAKRLTQGVNIDMAILGDELAITQYIESELRDRPHNLGSQILLIKSPRVAYVLGKEMFKEESLKSYGDLAAAPTHFAAATIVLDNIRNSNEFSQNVVDWGRRMHLEIDDNSSGLKALRDWYRANEAKLKAGDYKSVEPGDVPPNIKRSPAAVMPATPSAAAPVVVSAIPSANSLSSPESKKGYFWGAVLILVTGGCLVWVFGRKRS